MAKEMPRRPIDAVFSQLMISVIGTGTTARKTELVTYFHAKERPDGVIELQTLVDKKPFGKMKEISLDELLEQYTLEPQLSLERAQEEKAREMEVRKAVARGDKFFKQGKTYSAEFEYGKALDLDEDNVRANFGIGQCYIVRGDTEKARDVFQRLVRLDAAFQDEHKHLFNEFGISLRKSQMHPEALAYYSRALELSPADENLHYNMARAAYGMGDAGLAVQHLRHCLKLNSGHNECLQFQDFLMRKHPDGE
jgi:tetratricopeptide (TPR) repeat protein